MSSIAESVIKKSWEKLNEPRENLTKKENTYKNICIILICFIIFLYIHYKITMFHIQQTQSGFIVGPNSPFC